jgi:hypothetical protein
VAGNVKPTFPRLRRSNPLSYGLLGAYPLYGEGGTIARDISGQGNDGTLSGAVKPTWLETGGSGPNRIGSFGYGLTFDGSTSYVDCGNFADNLPKMSAAAWVRVPAGGAAHAIVVAKLASPGGLASGAGWGLFFGGGKVGAAIQQSGSIFSNPGGTTNLSDGDWHHVAFSWDGTLCKVYGDGRLEGTDTMHGAFTGYSNAVNVRIGTDQINELFWPSSIDDVFIWNRAISQAEIAALRYDTFQMVRTPRSIIAASAAAPVLLPSVRPKPSNPRLQKSVPLSQGLILGWPLGEGSGPSTQDVVEGGQDHAGVLGTFPGGVSPVWNGPAATIIGVNGHAGNWLTFDGIGSNVVGTNTINVAENRPAFTVACLGYATGGPANEILIAKTTAAGIAGPGWALLLTSLQRVVCTMTDASLVNTSVSTPGPTFWNDNWHLFAFTWGNQTLSLYVDGQFVGNDGGGSGLGNFSSGTNIRLGTDEKGEGFFQGDIESAWIWNRVLSAAEMAYLYYDTYAMVRPRRALLRPPVPPSISIQEIREGPPMRAVPWRKQEDPLGTFGQPPPPLPPLLSAPYLQEIHAGPAMRGVPWQQHLPIEDALLVGIRFPKPPTPPPTPGKGPAKPFIERWPDVSDPRRLGRITDKISSMINSLAGQALIQKTGPSSFLLRASAIQLARAPTAADDVTTGATVGTVWINTVTQQLWICVANAQGAAVWRGPI